MTRTGKTLMRLMAAWGLTTLLGCCAEAPDTSPSSLTVAAASSLGPAVEEAVALWSEATGRQAAVVLGASSTLARQIQNGAPFDVFVTAHSSWMDVLVADGLVGEGEPVRLANNGLVVVEPVGQGAHPADDRRVWGAALFASGRWALGDPTHVPAGVYAKQSIESVEAWATVEPRVVPTSSARAALRLVQQREVDFGIVYRTDALGSDDVVIVAAIPADAHAAATVMAARLHDRHSARGSGTHEGAQALQDWIAGPEVRALLRQRGFSVEGL